MRLAAFLIPALALVGVASAGPDPPLLRVVTLNVLHGGVLSGLTGDDQRLVERLAIQAEELAALDPDVVGLQEASTGRRRGSVAARLAASLGYHHVYAPALFRIFPAEWLNDQIAALLDFTEGPAILSRFPIVASEALNLPRCGRLVDSRVLLFATIRTPQGDVGVFSTHTSGDACHTRAVAELVVARRGDLPAVLMGDMNAVEDSPAVTALTRDAGFVDAFRAANPTAPGLTVWQRVDTPAPMARRRVDYVFLVPGREVTGAVRTSRVVLDAPRHLPDGTVLWPSDHHGVLADLALFPPEEDAASTARDAGACAASPAAAGEAPC